MLHMKLELSCRKRLRFFEQKLYILISAIRVSEASELIRGG